MNKWGDNTQHENKTLSDKSKKNHVEILKKAKLPLDLLGDWERWW